MPLGMTHFQVQWAPDFQVSCDAKPGWCEPSKYVTVRVQIGPVGQYSVSFSVAPIAIGLVGPASAPPQTPLAGGEGRVGRGVAFLVGVAVGGCVTARVGDGIALSSGVTVVAGAADGD